MISKIAYGLLDFAFSFVDVFTQPIDDFISSNLPDLSNAIGVINNFFHTIEDGFSWFIYLIPPNTLLALTIFITVFSSGYGLVLTFKLIQWVIDLVKRANVLSGK